MFHSEEFFFRLGIGMVNLKMWNGDSAEWQMFKPFYFNFSLYIKFL